MARQPAEGDRQQGQHRVRPTIDRRASLMTAAPFLAAGTDLLSGSTGVQVVTGFDRLRMHRGELEALAQRCRAGVTGRSTWMLGSAGNGPEPWAVQIGRASCRER